MAVIIDDKLNVHVVIRPWEMHGKCALFGMVYALIQPRFEV